MTFEPNDGTRPSLLELGRRATGEVDGPVDAAFASALTAARAKVEPFDARALFAAAARLDHAEAHTPPARPVVRRAWWWMLVPALAAAVAVVAVLPPAPTDRIKGTSELHFEVMRGNEIFEAGEIDAVRAGDRIQLATTSDASTVVLLGIDGTGDVTVYFPAAGDAPLPIAAGGPHRLPDAIELDDAPGPEVFVALFDSRGVSEDLALVSDLYDTRGLAGVLDLTDDADDVAVVVLDKE